MTDVSFKLSYVLDFYFSLLESKSFSNLGRKMKGRIGASLKGEEIETVIDGLAMSKKGKLRLKEENARYRGEWQNSIGGLEEKRKMLEEQWRKKEKEFLEYMEGIGEGKFKAESIDCFFLSSKRGGGIISSHEIYLGIGIPSSLLSWACAFEYLRLFFINSILSEKDYKKELGKKRYEAFCRVAISLLLLDSPFSISERSEFLAWCLSLDDLEWEILKKCYPLWLSKENLSCFLEEGRRAIKA